MCSVVGAGGNAADVRSLAESKTLKVFPLVTYAVAMGFGVWAIVGAFMLMSESVIGGLAVLLAALILLGMILWRFNFKWRQLHPPSSSP